MLQKKQSHKKIHKKLVTASHKRTTARRSRVRAPKPVALTVLDVPRAQAVTSKAKKFRTGRRLPRQSQHKVHLRPLSDHQHVSSHRQTVRHNNTFPIFRRRKISASTHFALGVMLLSALLFTVTLGYMLGA